MDPTPGRIIMVKKRHFAFGPRSFGRPSELLAVEELAVAVVTKVYKDGELACFVFPAPDLPRDGWLLERIGADDWEWPARA
jgi:hypothetical protein